MEIRETGLFDVENGGLGFEIGVKYAIF